MNISRNSSIVARAFWNFLGASILTTVAGQMAMSVDAAIVSHLIGPHAMAAVNMVMPVLTIFLSLNSLLGVGASLLAAKAIGNRDNDAASRIFSAAFHSVIVLGVVVSLVSFLCADSIASFLCADDSIRPLVFSYLRITSVGVTVLVLSGMFNMMVQSDGRPRLVTVAVLAGALSNIVLDYTFIRFFGMGIAGSAWATIINYCITVLVVMSHLRRQSCSYTLMRPSKELCKPLKDNLKQGLPLMIANVMLGVIIFLINTMVGGALGTDGLYIVAVCMQLLMITFVVLNGVVDAMFAVGGSLLGERDVLGLRMLNRCMLRFVGVILLVFTLLVLAVPSLFAAIFGADDASLRTQLCDALRVFSLILLPFSLTVLMRATFQTLGHLTLSTTLVIGQLVAIVACLWAFTQWAPQQLWWSFPLSAVLLLCVQVAVTWRLSRRTPGTHPMTLLPQPLQEAFDASTTSDAQPSQVIEPLSQHLDKHSIDVDLASRILKQATATLDEIHTASTTPVPVDVHLAIAPGEVQLVIKDAGPSRGATQSFGLNITSTKW